MGCEAGPGPRPASWKRIEVFLSAAKRPTIHKLVMTSLTILHALHNAF